MSWTPMLRSLNREAGEAGHWVTLYLAWKWWRWRCTCGAGFGFEEGTGYPTADETIVAAGAHLMETLI
jgi:hypothetical protein